MKRFLCLFILMKVAFMSPSSQAQIDYYSGHDIIKGDVYTYAVTHNIDYVIVENVNNIKSREPIIWTNTGERAMYETRPLAEKDSKKLREIVLRVFTKKEIRKYTKSKNRFDVGVIIDPKTGSTLEVGFTLSNKERYNDPILLSIPLSKIEQLETLLKQELYWKVAPESEYASHIGLTLTIFTKRLRYY